MKQIAEGVVSRATARADGVGVEEGSVEGVGAGFRQGMGDRGQEARTLGAACWGAGAVLGAVLRKGWTCPPEEGVRRGRLPHTAGVMWS